MIPHIESIKNIEKQYQTGEEPVMVLCSDLNPYICKYMRSSSPSYKLICEFVGSLFARIWGVRTPEIAFVRIKGNHWNGLSVPHILNVPSLGSKYIQGVIDISPSTYREIEPTIDLLNNLLEIALLDIWLSNEDRNINNANLMYELDKGRFVAIDFGCIFNTATFDYELTQLTVTDSILYSDLFRSLASGINKSIIQKILDVLNIYYMKAIERSVKQKEEIIKHLPVEWCVPPEVVNKKLEELFTDRWIKDSWENFRQNVYENLN